MDLHFEAKRDLWLSIVIWMTSLAMLAGGARLAQFDRWPGAIALGVAAAFPLWVFYGTYYMLSQDRLIVRSGPFRWKVPLEEIISMQPSRDPIASPATSLDRIEIRYGQGEKILLVSPARKEEFCAAVNAARSAAA